MKLLLLTLILAPLFAPLFPCLLRRALAAATHLRVTLLARRILRLRRKLRHLESLL